MSYKRVRLIWSFAALATFAMPNAMAQDYGFNAGIPDFGGDYNNWGSPGKCDFSLVPPGGLAQPELTCTAGAMGELTCLRPVTAGEESQGPVTHTVSGTVLCGETDETTGDFITDHVAWFTLSGTVTGVTISCTNSPDDQCVHSRHYTGGGAVDFTLTHNAALDGQIPTAFCSSSACPDLPGETLVSADPSGLSTGAVKKAFPADGDLVEGQLLRFVEDAVSGVNVSGAWNVRFCTNNFAGGPVTCVVRNSPPAPSTGSVDAPTTTLVPVDWQKVIDTLNASGAPNNVKMAVFNTATFDVNQINTSTIRVSAGPTEPKAIPFGFNVKTVAGVTRLEFFVEEGVVANTLAPGTISGQSSPVCAEGATTGAEPLLWEGCDNNVIVVFSGS